MPLKTFSPRKTAPKVKGGSVQKKNRHRLTPTYWNTRQAILVIDRERPGRGYRHLLRKDDVVRFIELLPEWDELSEGLNAILLAAGSEDEFGWYDRGVVGICAWESLLPRVWPRPLYRAEKEVLDAIGVPATAREHGVLCAFTAETARAYQILNIFLHELGHHHDRMDTRSKRESSRGEPYAEAYARRYEKLIFARYCEAFHPPKAV